MSIQIQCRDQLNKMIHLLQGEISDIRKGEFGSLETLAAEKLAGIKALDNLLAQLVSIEDKSALGPLISKLNRVSNENGVLLKSIYNGSRAAQARLQSLQKDEASAGVYGRNGEALSLPDSYITNEKSV